MNIVTVTIRESIKSSIKEYCTLVSKLLSRYKGHISQEEAITFENVVKLSQVDWRVTKHHLALSEETFQAIRKEIADLIAHVTSNRDNIQIFLSGLPSIFTRFGIEESEYWTDCTMRKFSV